MTSENDDEHILYAKGDFEFIDHLTEYKKISKEMIIMLRKAYEIYIKHDMEKFFTTYEPPSDHKYMWWLPHQQGFEEWNKMRIIFLEELFDKIDPLSADFDLVTRILSHIANQGWQSLISSGFENILDYILENYWNYEIFHLT